MSRARVALLAVWVGVLVVCVLVWVSVAVLVITTNPATPSSTSPPPLPTISIDPTVPVSFSTTTAPLAAPLAAVSVSSTTGRAVTPAARPVPPPSWARCPRLWRPAQRAGWPPELLPTLDFIAARESGCGADLINERSGDWGWLQIHWRHLTTPGWTGLCARTAGQVCTTDDLLVMRLNLRAGWVLFQVHEKAFGCGWRPWHTNGWRPC